MNSSVVLAVPIQFIPNPWDKKDSFERAETFMAALQSVGFDVIIERNDGRWRAV